MDSVHEPGGGGGGGLATPLFLKQALRVMSVLVNETSMAHFNRMFCSSFVNVNLHSNLPPKPFGRME